MILHGLPTSDLLWIMIPAVYQPEKSLMCILITLQPIKKTGARACLLQRMRLEQGVNGSVNIPILR